MSLESVAERRAEFDAFVWNHGADAFQAKFDTRAKLTNEEVTALCDLLSPQNAQTAEAMAIAVSQGIKTHPHLLRLLLQLSGLTRNKIIQDIKAYARTTDTRVQLSTPESIFRSPIGVTLGSRYLATQLMRVYGGRGTVTAEMLEAVNQATWPGYIRQERAKRMGHEAEYRLACLFRDCGISFAPEEKAENPLCRDININDVSYDLVSPSAGSALLRIKSTVHTANIGQYGESKDELEMREAVAAITAETPPNNNITLLAFIDGVGFESNRAGLEGVLSNAHEFCQFRTVWKAAVIAANKSGQALRVALPAEQGRRFASFQSRWVFDLEEATPSIAGDQAWIPSGDGFLHLTKRPI